MKINSSKDALPVFAALNSETRLNIIYLLSQESLNISQLAEKLNVSSAVMTKHIKKLETANIVSARTVNGNAGLQKMCSLKLQSLEIVFPQINKSNLFHSIDIPVGRYMDIEATPTCGLASPLKIIGNFDDPRVFFLDERIDASILWFTTGRIKYSFPNYLLSSQKPTSVEISMELGSEAPAANNNWPSDISFILNGKKLCEWTSPGDFADRRGRYTPSWWGTHINQYGFLKVIRITSKGVFLDGELVSDLTIDNINIDRKVWTFELSVDENCPHPGGLTIYGKNFGNYDQNIIVNTYYEIINLGDCTT